MRDLIQQNPGAWLAAGGLFIGLVFGFLVYRTNFCTMGSISDILSFGDYRRFRAWVLAAGVALVGTQVLAGTGVVPLAKSMYLAPSLNWFGHLIGGLMFGFGMVYAGGCASRNLARIGGGDLRSLITLIVMGLFAYMAIGGLLGPIRSWLEQVTAINLGGVKLATQSLGELVGALTPLGPARGSTVVTALITFAVAVYCFMDAEFRGSPVHILAGVGVGLCTIAGWALTGLAYDDLADKPTTPISLTYVRPTADAIEWLQRFTAGRMPGFGVTTVFGAIFGAFIAAKSMGRFKLATFSNLGDTKRSLLGAALMGVGGVMALGCTVGQAITGVSTLAIGSFLTFAAIVIGGIIGMKRLEASLMDEV
ncbi:MAG: YeeE/YedE family protein [Hyphomicrobiaceae bacterium]